MRVLQVLVIVVLLALGLSQVFRRDAPPAPSTAAATGSPAATSMPPSRELPNYRPDMPERTDLRGGAEGIPMKVRYVVKDPQGQPVDNAKVEVWHTNAKGGYSYDADTFCRGWSTTGSDGTVEFQTLRPSSYGPPGGHAHVHARVSKDGVGDRGDQLDLPDGEERVLQPGLAGWFEGDTLVVEVTLPRPGPNP